MVKQEVKEFDKIRIKIPMTLYVRHSLTPKLLLQNAQKCAISG